MTLDPVLMALFAVCGAMVCGMVGLVERGRNRYAGYLGFGFVVVAFVMWAAA